ncbi:MAG: outer membrane beta-barrel protein [Saprospiraceae bacterium]|nr:outer membrane beta-barrel protein [Candidatus Brachybacter algidus]
MYDTFIRSHRNRTWYSIYFIRRSSGGLDIYSAKTDYSSQYKNGLKLEFGGKTSYVKADNDIKFFDKSTETAVLIPLKATILFIKKISTPYTPTLPANLGNG